MTEIQIEKLSGGRSSVKVGDIVTPKDKNIGASLEVIEANNAAQYLRVSSAAKKESQILPTTVYLTSHSELQALAQLESIREMLKAKADAKPDSREYEDAHEAIQQDPLSVEVRSGWVEASKIGGFGAPAEFKILLCTGGPAVQIIGELDEHSKPEKPRLQHQDWGTPWTDVRLSAEDEETLLAYCREFFFGE